MSLSKVFITRSASVSSLGTSAKEIKNSFLKGQSNFTALPDQFLHTDIPIKFISSIVGVPPVNTLFYRENFKDITGPIIEKLFVDWQPLKSIDLILFCNNTGPNHEENILNHKPYLQNSDFTDHLKKCNQNLDKTKVIQFVNTCASGTAAIEWSARQIKNKIFNRVLIVSYEFTNHLYYNYQHFLSLGVLAQPKQLHEIELSYSKKRNGFIKADSMVYILLESEQAHPGSVLAEVLGGYSESDCETISDGLSGGAAVEKLVEKSLALSGISVNSVDYISGHGSATVSNDKDELGGLEKVFSRSDKKPILHSLKSWAGHSLSSAALLEIDALLKMFQWKMALGNLHMSDPEATQHLQLKKGCLADLNLEIILKTSFGFGGFNSALVLKNQISP